VTRVPAAPAHEAIERAGATLSRARVLALALVAACTAHEVPAPVPPAPPPPAPPDAVLMSELDPEADDDSARAVEREPEPETPPPPRDGWLRGSTHVHARPSGDSTTPIPDVIAWYEQRGYDFIVLTDHNRVTPPPETHGLVVIAGTELTHNPVGCQPPGDKSRKCRIHVNAIGVTARPIGKIEWAERKSHLRVDMYQAGIARARLLGARLVQINHPQWFWGMTPDVLVEIAARGAQLVEIDNVQFEKWNNGDVDHPSMEALWDAALVRGARLWGIASDDAHDYGRRGKYPAGGGWIAVRAKKDAAAILDAIAAGAFYSSNGVVLERADRDGDDVVVEVAAGERGEYEIDWIENGAVVERARGRSARRQVPASGYVRAVVVRDDGKKAWTQPARR
jgi:hypothetical protein